MDFKNISGWPEWLALFGGGAVAKSLVDHLLSRGDRSIKAADEAVDIMTKVMQAVDKKLEHARQACDDEIQAAVADVKNAMEEQFHQERIFLKRIIAELIPFFPLERRAGLETRMAEVLDSIEKRRKDD